MTRLAFLYTVCLLLCSWTSASIAEFNGLRRATASATSDKKDRRPRFTLASLLPQKLRCALALRRSGFNISDFAKYPQFFGNDSIVELAQAGQYKGAADIEEYVKFVYQRYSPYLLDTNFTETRRYNRQNKDNKILGMNAETGQCEYLSLFKFKMAFDPATTNGGAMSSFNIIGFIKLFLDVETNIISRFNVYFAVDFLRIFIAGALNSTQTRRFLCNDVWANGPCAAQLPMHQISNNGTGVNSTEALVEYCLSGLQALPIADGPYLHIDGNSLGCRALHGAFAQTNPTMHCAHLSLEPVVDSMGRLKCQSNSSRAVSPTDLFTESDFKAYRRFARKVGMDADKGHDYPDL